MKKLALLALVAMSLILVSCGDETDTEPTVPYTITVVTGGYRAAVRFDDGTTTYTYTNGSNTIRDTRLSTNLTRVSGTGTADNPFIGTWMYLDGDEVTFYSDKTLHASWFR